MREGGGKNLQLLELICDTINVLITNYKVLVGLTPKSLQLCNFWIDVMSLSFNN